jgi:predicted permease
MLPVGKPMKTVRRFLKRLFAWSARSSSESRFQAEIEEHIALQTSEFVRSGLNAQEARRQALLKFGARSSIQDSYREQSGLPFLDSLLLDIRYGLRRLRKTPAFTATTIATLALGIGATTSIFTLVYAVLLKQLAVSKPADLMRLGREIHCCVWAGYSQTGEFSLISYDLYKHFRDHTEGFSELAAFQAGGGAALGVRRTNHSEPSQSFPAEFVSGNYFAMFGINAFAGRTIRQEDDQPAAAPVAVMSYRLWQERYGGDLSVIGSTFNLNEKSFTIVGITPPAFFGDTLRAEPPDFFLPVTKEPLISGENSLLYQPDLHWLDVIGRLKPGVRPASVEAQMRGNLKNWLRAHWGAMDANARANFGKQTLFLSPGGAGITRMRELYERWLHILFLISGFVLLIVCANVANLMLVRGLEQREQLSLSVALGARPRRLVRQALVESVLLAMLGGGAGLAIAFAGTRLILHFGFPVTAGLGSVPIDASLSWPVLLFTLSTSFITGVAFGVAPAILSAKADPIEALRGANRSFGRSASWPRKALVVAQAALSLSLLSASGLLSVVLQRLQTQDFGFKQERRTLVSIEPQLAGYHPEQLSPLYKRIQETMLRLPGVKSAALCAYSPLSGGGWTDGVFLEGKPASGPNDNINSNFLRVGPGFFESIGVPLLQGRGISEHDTDNAQHVAVVNEAFVKRFFRGESPIGKHFGRSEKQADRMYQIVGVVKDARYTSSNLNQPVEPMFFLPEAQKDVFSNANFTTGDIRTHYLGQVVVVSEPGTTINSAVLRKAIASVDPNLPVSNVQSMQVQVDAQFTQQRLLAWLTSFFGLLSLVLAAIGIYGLTAFNVSRRTAEIGLRMALGADRGDILSLILKGAFVLIALGLVFGLPLTLWIGRLLGNQLYGVNPFQAWVLLSSILVLALAAFFASLVPALRAARLSPLESLRAD